MLAAESEFEPHIDHDNVPRFLSMYHLAFVASRTSIAHVHIGNRRYWTRRDSEAAGVAALTESVYKLELLPVALYDADDQKATTCTARR